MVSLVTNLGADVAAQNASLAKRAVSASLNRLASGVRINSAADDASGLSIAKQFEAEVRATQQAQRNTNDVASALQTADAGYEGIGEALGRMRELAVQAANGTLSDADRAHIDEEFSSLRQEVDRIADSTNFNGQKLLNNATTITAQAGTGATASDTISVTTTDANSAALGGATPLNAQNTATAGAATAAIGSIDKAIADISGARARVGSGINRLEMASDNLFARRANIMESLSRIRDTDVAEETAKSVASQIRLKGAIAVQAQANVSQSTALSLLGKV